MQKPTKAEKTHALQQMTAYSITSSARDESAGFAPLRMRHLGTWAGDASCPCLGIEDDTRFVGSFHSSMRHQFS